LYFLGKRAWRVPSGEFPARSGDKRARSRLRDPFQAGWGTIRLEDLLIARRSVSAIVFAPTFVAAVGLLFTAAAFASPEKSVPPAGKVRETAADGALARLAALAGEWEGSFEWTGGRTSRGGMNARYFTTGNGSAVVENLIMDGVPVMTTVYHTDGPDLRMTHYCAARNQPRLKASKIDLAGGSIDFAFVDATNLSAPDAPHVNGLEVRFGDDDHVTLTFLFEGGGKPARERISLLRARPKA
jgi:hypothetical protein